MRRLALLALLGAAVVALWFQLPAATHHLQLPPDPRSIRGAVHVHTVRSDGAGTPGDVARDAARAGLDFVILTDHGDGTRVPDPPRFIDGVLVVDAVEISTTGGHYLALGVGKVPYRLAGEPRDVIEDVGRFGGFGIAAHPDSPKPELSWRDWQSPFDGLEWLNADSAWRDEDRRSMARALITYPWRRPEVIASLFDRPSLALARWDALARRRPVVGIAGHDAHARMGLRGNLEPGEGEYSLRVPSYEAAFRTFSLGVRVREAWPRGAGADAARASQLLLEAIRNGRVSTVIDAIAGPARLTFSASSNGSRAEMGGRMDGLEDVVLSAALEPALEQATLTLIGNGEVVSNSRGSSLRFEHRAGRGPVVYRVEASLPHAPGMPQMPWIVGNPIYVGTAPRLAALPLLAPPAWAAPVPQQGWMIEKHPASTASLASMVLTPDVTAWTLQWRLAGGMPSGQYVALVVPLTPGRLSKADRISFSARASRPMRISVQLRIPNGKGLRWQRSVYVSPAAEERVVAIREMSPVEATPGTPLALNQVDSLLFVVDTVNTPPGTAGETWISAVRVEGAR